MLRKWLEPGKTPFLVLTVFFFVMAIVCFAQGITEGGVMCAVFGLLGLIVHGQAKK